MMRGKILITGGAGFLGRGILRQAAREKWDNAFTVYSRDEYKQHLCKDKYPNVGYMLGDIRDTDRLALAMRGHDIVIHAAALKYVPESERNVDEAIGINVFGSQSVVKAAREAKVKAVVFISTDKAVEPVNTYGLSKALAERVAYEASWLVPSVKFVTCRYGNVIGSTGSVLPVFKHQLNTLGHVNVTDPDMTRFWIPVDQAVDLIELTLDQPTGSIVIPNPLALRIGDIAKAIANDKINYVGLRPGEKMHEALLTEAEFVKCFTDEMFDQKFWVYHPDRKPNTHITAMRLTSGLAKRLTAAQFMEHATDAETI